MPRIVEGNTLDIKEMFTDEYGGPIIPDEDTSGPIVTLYDTDKAVIFQSISSPTTVPGEWQVNMPIPYMDLIDDIDLQLEWTMFDTEGTFHKTKVTLTVQPSTDNRQSDIVVLKRPNDTFVTFVVPVKLSPTDTLVLDAALNNEFIIDNLNLLDAAQATTQVTANQVTIKMPAVVDTNIMRLEPISVTVTHTDTRRMLPKLYNFNLWIITPQIAVGMNMLEQFIDKAKLENVIPSLQYAAGDLVQYLYRGLQMFNQYPPHITSFRGTNMQGVLLECWITCSSHAALSAQLLAEGAHAFDFSGQTVNLNVDRTPSIEAALGRLETQIENSVKPYKKLLNKAGINTGDGSIGSKAPSAGQNFGHVGVINSPTTRLGRGPGGWVRSPMRNFGR